MPLGATLHLAVYLCRLEFARMTHEQIRQICLDCTRGPDNMFYCGDVLTHKSPGLTAAAFNKYAKAIAALSFLQEGFDWEAHVARFEAHDAGLTAG